MMQKTTVEECETIIQYNDSSNMAGIYTHDKAFQRYIEKELGIKAWRVQGPAKDYEIPKKWLRWPRKPSEKRREASRKALEARGGRIAPKNMAGVRP